MNLGGVNDPMFAVMTNFEAMKASKQCYGSSYASIIP